MSDDIEIIVSEEKDGSLIGQWDENGKCTWILATDYLSDEQLDAFKKVSLVTDNPSLILRLVMWIEWQLTTIQYKVGNIFRKNREQ